MPDEIAADREVVIAVRDIGKMYRIYDRPQDRLKQMLFWRFGRGYGREFWALRDISFEVRRGDTVGIIGRNGSGKSTLLQIIAGTLAPSMGEVMVKGRVAALLELGSGFNPEFTGRENVFLNGAILGISREEMEARFNEIAAFADIGEFIDQPIKIYSSGMVVRLAFAVAACIEPDILIVDEALAVGDIAFQARCLERIRVLKERGTTTLFVTHDSGTFQSLCDYGYLLDHGHLFAHGRPAQVALQYYELVRETEHARQRLSSSDHTQAPQVQAELSQREDEIRGKTSDGEYRFGTGAAHIIDYCVRDTAGRETNTLRIDDPFRVEVEVAFYGPVANLSIGIIFRNPQGQNLMGMHSYHEHRYHFGPHSANERIRISCDQTMLLNPGEYLLGLSIADCRSDYDFTSLDNRTNMTKITVIGTGVHYGLVRTQPRFSYRATSIGYTIEQITSLYEHALSQSHIQDAVAAIMRHDEQPSDDGDLIEKEEHSWPGEPRFVESGYYRRMLGRYAFAGSQFCHNADVLDTCSGLGWGAYLVAQYARQVTAFDRDLNVVQQCAEWWPADTITWLTGDARDLSFLGDALFDVALGMETIEHLTADDGARYVAEVATHLRPGGVFIGTSAFPETREEAEQIRSTNPFHLHIFTKVELESLLARHFSTWNIIAGWMFIAVK